MSIPYVRGATIRLTGTFQDINNVPTAPGGTVTLRVYDPTGTLNATFTGGQLQSGGTGVFFYDFPTAGLATGYWHFAYSSTGGTIVTAQKGMFEIVLEST